jgi:hypothetical protein
VHLASTRTWSSKLNGPHVGATLGLYVSVQGAVPLAAIVPNDGKVLRVPLHELGRTVGQLPEPGDANVPLTQSYTVTPESGSCVLPFVTTPSTPT